MSILSLKKLAPLFLLGIIVSLSWPAIALAEGKVGVGIGTGKIVLDEKLKPGTHYELPLVTVLNTGEVEAEYFLDVTYHEQQPEKRPPLEWFSFSPNHFDLKPGETQAVKVTLTLPIKTEPAGYFAYVEARPNIKAADGGTTIGIAAAAKLYFGVDPANIFQGAYYRLISLYGRYRTPLLFVIGVGVVFIVIQAARKFIAFDIKLKPKSKKTEESEPKSSD